jgi:hypothetical protein
MAATVAELMAVLKLKDEMSSSLGSIMNNVKGSIAGMLSLGAAIKGISSAVSAQSQAMAAVNQLNLALANQGNYSKAVSADLRAYADQLQATTQFEGDATVASMALLASFGLMPDQIKAATGAAADFAAATGKDLDSVMNTLGKAAGGNTAMLEKMGFQFDKGSTDAQKFASAIEQINSRFGGSAAAAAQTYEGQMAQLTNTLGDVQEAVGKMFMELGGGGGGFSAAQAGLQWLQEFFGVTLVLVISEIRAQILEMLGAVAGSGDLLQPLFDVVDAILSIGEKMDPLGLIEKSGLKDLAASAREFSNSGPATEAALREQANQVREAGTAAALSAGQTKEFANQSGNAGKVSKEAAEAAKKWAEEVKKIGQAYSGVTAQVEMNKLADAFKNISLDDMTDKNMDKLIQQVRQLQEEGAKTPEVFMDLGLTVAEQASQAEAALEDLNAFLKAQGESAAENLFKDMDEAAKSQVQNIDATTMAIAETRQEWINAVHAAEQHVRVTEQMVKEGKALPEDLKKARQELDALKNPASQVLTIFQQFKHSLTGGQEGIHGLANAFNTVLGVIDQAVAAIGRFNSATQSGSSLERMFGGSQAGASLGRTIGGLFGEQGAAIGQAAGAIIGGIAGFFREPEWVETGREAGVILGESISDEMAQAIQQTMDDLNINVEAASLLHINDVMAESGRAAVAFAPQMQNLLRGITEGSIPAEEGLEALGQAFTTLGEDAAEAGERAAGVMQQMLLSGNATEETLRGVARNAAEQSAAMIRLIQQAREAGQVVPEMQAVVDAAMSSAREGVGQMVEGINFADPASAAAGAHIFAATFWATVREEGIVAAAEAMMPAWQAMQDKLAESGIDPAVLQGIFGPMTEIFDMMGNETFAGMISGLEGARQAVAGLSDAGYMTQGAFQGLQTLAASTYQQLIDGGASSQAAFAAIAPSLGQIIMDAERYGLTLDANTQALIAQAEAAGVSFPTDPLLQVVSLLETIAKQLGADIPGASQAAKGELESLGDSAKAGAEGAVDAMAGLEGELEAMGPAAASAAKEMAGGMDEVAAAMASAASEGAADAALLAMSLSDAGAEAAEAFLQTADDIVSALAAIEPPEIVIPISYEAGEFPGVTGQPVNATPITDDSFDVGTGGWMRAPADGYRPELHAGEPFAVLPAGSPIPGSGTSGASISVSVGDIVIPPGMDPTEIRSMIVDTMINAIRNNEGGTATEMDAALTRRNS